jgi:phage-related protein (TIGR01555 family)
MTRLPPKVIEALSQGAGEARADGWQNLISGLGTSRDKRTGGEFCADVVTDQEARELWLGDDLAAHGIETYPDEMLRAGFDVCVTPEDENDGDEARELGVAVAKALEALGTDAAFRTALCYERAYGGGAVFPVCNDGVGDLSMPLNEGNISEVSRLVWFEPCELQTASVYIDPTRPDYGRPATYKLQPITVQGASVATTVIHESRLIVFPGIQVTRAPINMQRQGWGGSVLSRIRTVLRDFNLGFGSASHLLNDFSQATMTVRGLKEILASPNGVDLMRRKMQIMDESRSALRMLLLDAGAGSEPAEQFKREATPMAGMPEMLDRLIDRLASALEEPASRFMKQAPGGLNPGDSETRWFYDRVSQKQDKHLRPRLDRLVRLLFLSRSGPSKGVLPATWKIDFHPLMTPSEKEDADARLVQAQVDEKYQAMGVLSPLDIVKSRFGPDGYSFDTKVDISEIEKMLEAEQNAPAPTRPPAGDAPAPTGDVDAPGDNADRAE